MHRKYLFALFFVFAHSVFADIPYRVQFDGVGDRTTLDVLRSVSQLVLLSDNPPATETGLQRRAEADIPNLIQGLQSLGHYEPNVQVSVDTGPTPAVIHIDIDLGPTYTLESFEIISDSIEDFPCSQISLKRLGITIGRPILPITILNAESSLLNYLVSYGYPLASITKREVIANEETQTISVILRVSSGPPACFGTTTIDGTLQTSDFVILKKIYWNYGEPYSPAKIEKTRQELEAAGLFCSVDITSAEELEDGQYLPMFIAVTESRHRTVGLGLSYNTELGPGFTGSWEHRNIRSMGEKIRLHTDLWKDRQRGILLYTQPDLYCPGQDLLWIAEAERNRTKGFTENFVTLSAIMDRRLNDYTKYSYGVAFKQLESEDTADDNGSFTLLKLPVTWRWTNADSLLDPSMGTTLFYLGTPTFQIINPRMFYMIQTLTLMNYLPLTKDCRHILAGKAHIGTISGETKKAIPAPERFYAGSENTLRGYRYLTVSPLNAENDPVGGRSIMIYSLELRSRITQTIGWVTFFDIGNVYSPVWPVFNHKQLKSVGAGLRYHTPVGPLRADFAIPLNRRKGIDNKWELYISIGQAF